MPEIPSFYALDVRRFSLGSRLKVAVDPWDLSLPEHRLPFGTTGADAVPQPRPPRFFMSLRMASRHASGTAPHARNADTVSLMVRKFSAVPRLSGT